MINFNSNQIKVIAEIGVNHNGDIIKAKKLILAAKKSGADFVKFQNFKAENLATKHAEMAKYQIKNTKKKEKQISMLKALELKRKFYPILKKFAKKNKVNFLSSPFDEDNYMYLTNTLKCKLIKIPSGEINNFVMLRHVKLNKEKLIISTGMSTIKEIAETLNYISKKKIFKTFNNNVKIIDKKSHNFLKSRVLLMHCVTDYPVLDKFANLSAIKNFIEKFNLHVGYSDHTQDILAPIISASYGAKYIEKHLTLDQNDNGPDHRASIEPDLFKQMVVNLRKFENMKGNGIKKVEQCEQKNILIARKSLIAKKNIKKGDKFSYKNITAKRPGNGVSVSKIDKYLGKRAKKDYFTDDFI